VNIAFLVVVVAASTGLASLFALRPLAPTAGPIVALAVMAVALLVAARRQRKLASLPSPEEVTVPAAVPVPVQGVSESLKPA
jgi:MYXO-CTERM domain-containing protein